MIAINRFKIDHKDRNLYDCVISDNSCCGRSDALCSLIIGKNGSGKSYLLSQIAEFFKYIKDVIGEAKNQPKSYRYQNVLINYSVDNNEYEISYNNRSLSFKENGKIVEFYNVRLPERILAISFIVNDKFVYGSEPDSFYCYLGVRASSNVTYTSSLQKKIFQAFLMSIKDESRNTELLRVLDFVNLQPSIRLTLPCLRKTLFSRKINYETVYKKISNTSYFKNKHSNNPVDSERIIQNLVEFINNRLHGGQIMGHNLVYDIDLLDAKKFFDKSVFLEVLIEMGYLSTPRVDFFKKDSFSFDFASSGEKHLLFTLLNLIAWVKNNSIILIDEPEISMHPSWQMKYINLIKKLLRDFSSCHCILSSHSHFMVSDLDPQSSSLVQMEDVADDEYSHRVSSLIKYDTYAWSAESILYRIFGMRTSRNYYFEQDLSELLSLISHKSSDYEKIKKIVQKFNSLVLDDKDPLVDVLKRAHFYLKKEYDQ